jgi:hypothetical protein
MQNRLAPAYSQRLPQALVTSKNNKDANAIYAELVEEVRQLRASMATYRALVEGLLSMRKG